MKRTKKEMIISNSKNLVANDILDTDGYTIKINEPISEWFDWASGVKAPVFCNCRKLVSYPHIRDRIVDSFIGIIKENFPDVEAIGTVAVAGIPWGSFVAQKLNLPLVYVRREKKDYGIKVIVEGCLKESKKIVFIDDAVVSGDSLKKAIDNLFAETPNSSLLGIASIVNWNTHMMWKNFACFKVATLCDYHSVVKALHEREMISASFMKMLLAFYSDPFNFNWEDSEAC